MPGSEKRNSLNICFDTADVIDVPRLKDEMDSKYEKYTKHDISKVFKNLYIERGECTEHIGLRSRLSLR